MAKAAIAKKNSAFMKRVQPSEHLAKLWARNRFRALRS
jgi:hypothetical protein